MGRVLITGCGAVSAAGLGAAQLAGAADLSVGRTVPDSELKGQPEARGLGRLPAATRWACLAATEALAAAGGVLDGDLTGVLVGTNRSSAEPIAAFVADARNHGVRLVNPSFFPEMVMNALAGHVAMRFGLRGPTMTLSCGRLSGMQALSWAVDLLQTGQLGQAVVCGAETMAPAAGVYPPGEGCGAVVLQVDGELRGTPLAELVAITEVPLPGRTRADAAYACERAVGQHREEPPDVLIAPLRELEVPAGIPARDPWAVWGASDGVGTMFGLMAALRELQAGAERAWVVEPGDSALTICMLRTCS